MIEIHPMQDRDREQQLLAELRAEADDRILLMTDRDEELGLVAVRMRENTLCMVRFSVPGYDFSEKPQVDQIFILDALMRAAASYGETNGADYLETAFPDFYDFFRLRGFETDETHAFGAMSLVVKYE